MADENIEEGSRATLDEDSLLKFCNLVKSYQILAESELEVLQSDALLLPEKLNKLETVLSNQLGYHHHPLDVILNYNSRQLVEAWYNKSPLALIRNELRKKYAVIGDQPDKDNGWTWGEKVFPLGCMHVVRIDTGRRDTYFAFEEVNNLAILSKWCILILGVPGIGKTSFVWKLTREWAKRRILEYFLVVFYIDINTHSRLADALNILLGELNPLQTKFRLYAKSCSYWMGGMINLVHDGI